MFLPAALPPCLCTAARPALSLSSPHAQYHRRGTPAPWYPSPSLRLGGSRVIGAAAPCPPAIRPRTRCGMWPVFAWRGAPGARQSAGSACRASSSTRTWSKAANPEGTAVLARRPGQALRLPSAIGCSGWATAAHSWPAGIKPRLPIVLDEFGYVSEENFALADAIRAGRPAWPAWVNLACRPDDVCRSSAGRRAHWHVWPFQGEPLPPRPRPVPRNGRPTARTGPRTQK